MPGLVSGGIASNARRNEILESRTIQKFDSHTGPHGQLMSQRDDLGLHCSLAAKPDKKGIQHH